MRVSRKWMQKFMEGWHDEEGFNRGKGPNDMGSGDHHECGWQASLLLLLGGKVKIVSYE